MRIKLLILFFFSQFSGLFAQSYSGPESAEYDFANSRWLIANTQSHQVLARDMYGVLSVFTTLSGTGPYGIEIVGDTLFCCNGASIKGFLLSNATQVFNVNAGASFLNGITHDNSGNLIATDFSAKAIYKINISSQTVTPIATAMNTTPNGIIFDAANNRCIYVNWSTNAPIKAIDLSTNAISTLATTTLGSCDGIARDGHNNYYVTTWSTQSIVKFDSSFSSPPITIVTGLNNPADIFYNIQTDTLAIPNAGNSTVVYYGFNTVDVNELAGSNVKVYPSPCSSTLNVVSDNFNPDAFDIADLNGSVIMRGKCKMGKLTFDVSMLAAGEYILNLRTSDSEIRTRFFKR